MKTTPILLLLILLITVSCSKSDLQKDFNCNTNYDFGKTEIINDFKNKFSLDIPKKWSTKFFYNNFQTSFMTADSLKSLTNSFIIDVSLNNGELKINDDFREKIIRNIIKKEELKILKFKPTKFKNKDAIWFWSKGKRSRYDFHLFKMIVKNTATTYFEIETKIYGDSLVNERLCKSISIVETLKLLK